MKDFFVKHKSVIVMAISLAVIVAACVYIMIDSEKDDDVIGELIGEYDLSVSGDNSVTARLYRDGLLDISGSGRTKDLKDIPWIDHVYKIKQVRISDKITAIGNYTFYHCTSLISIEIPNGIIEIGEHAFDGSGLTSVTLPKTLEKIGKYAFDSTYLQAITIPSSVKDMGQRAFQNCLSLESVTFESGLKSIGDWAFYGCIKLKSVSIPRSISFIGKSAFYNCKELKSVTFESTAGWFKVTDSDAEKGEALDLKNAAANALALRETDIDYYYKTI